MQTLTKEEARDWCKGRSIGLDSRGRPDGGSADAQFAIPEDAGKKILLVAGHLQEFRDEAEVLVWFTEWGVWPSSERPHIFSRFRASYGEVRPLIEVPAQVFGAEEHEDVVSFATLGVLFLWDLFVVAGQGRPLLHYSHDQYGWLAKGTRRRTTGCS